MKYLLDTSVFLLALAAPDRLNRRSRELLSNARAGLFLSAASSWWKARKAGNRKRGAAREPVAAASAFAEGEPQHSSVGER